MAVYVATGLGEYAGVKILYSNEDNPQALFVYNGHTMTAWECAYAMNHFNCWWNDTTEWDTGDE